MAQRSGDDGVATMEWNIPRMLRRLLNTLRSAE
jgi:hypothetical protein